MEIENVTLDSQLVAGYLLLSRIADRLEWNDEAASDLTYSLRSQCAKEMSVAAFLIALEVNDLVRLSR